MNLFKLKQNKIIEYGIYLLVFLLPWQTRWIISPGSINNGYLEYLSISLFAVDILLLVLLFLFGLSYLKKEVLVKKQEKMEIPVIWWILSGLDLIVFVSIFLAPDSILALYRYLLFLLALGFFWLILKADYNKKIFYWSFLAGVLGQALLGIAQFLLQNTWPSKWLGLALHQAFFPGNSVIETAGGGKWLRAYGALSHPNVLGGLLVVGIFVLLHLFFKEKERKARIVYELVLAVFLTCLFFTFSRGAWLAFLIGFVFLLFVFILHKKTNIRRQAGLIILLIILLFTGLGWQYKQLLSARFLGNTRLEEKSVTERLDYFNYSQEIIADNFLLGTGVGNYTLALQEKLENKSPWFYQPVHNVFVLIAAEVGTIGLTFFLLLLGYIFWYSYRRKNWLGLSVLIAIIITMLVDHWWWSLHFGVLFFWFCLALILRINNKYKI